MATIGPKIKKPLIGSSRGRFIASLVPKFGISLDGEEYESDEGISEEAFLDNLAKNFEGVKELLDDVNELVWDQSDDEAGSWMLEAGSGLNESDAGKNDEGTSPQHNALVDADNPHLVNPNECDYLVVENELEIEMPDQLPSDQQDVCTARNTWKSPISAGNSLSVDSPLESSLSGNHRVTRSEKRNKARRPTTPPLLPVHSDKTNRPKLDEIAAEEPQLRKHLIIKSLNQALRRILTNSLTPTLQNRLYQGNPEQIELQPNDADSLVETEY